MVTGSPTRHDHEAWKCLPVPSLLVFLIGLTTLLTACVATPPQTSERIAPLEVTHTLELNAVFWADKVQHSSNAWQRHQQTFTFRLENIAGATGSGKTTTLHAMLNHLGASAGRIATLEDPVEIINPEAVQTDLSRLPHLNFASGLRSLMRQDPDTILVGEVRDEETAELTLNAALTGHRLF
eukprot:gene48438-64981_t